VRSFGPFFSEEEILYEDLDLVAVNKPFGMASQSADPEHPDDVATRLARVLEARDGRPTKIGIHQRLDRETSGVMVFGKSERGNRSLSTQFESRTIRKEYVAGVRGYRGGERRLEHRLGERHEGRVALDPRGKMAVSTVAPIERRGDRALLRVSLETGRTHQIRVQLAAIGSPVAGDRLYGDTLAPRMLLHAHRLVLARPADGHELVITAKVPRVFARFLEGQDLVEPEDAKGIVGALHRAFVSRASLFEARVDDRGIDAFRLLHEDGDGVRDLAVDVYGDYAVVHLYRPLAPEIESSILAAVHALSFEGVYVKRRPTNASTVVDTRREEFAPAHAVIGASAPDPIVLREHGVPYEVRLGDGLSTGIFLDQRDNRGRVRELARGKRVLNLFAYTGAFSCAAAAGGATMVTTVDVAAPALATAERSFSLGGYRTDHRIVRDDAFAFLEAAARAGERYDLVVCDPPTYSTTKLARWRSGADYRRLAALVFDVMDPGAVAFFCSNDRRMSEGAFRGHIAAAATQTGRRASLRAFDPPLDHPKAARAEATMKTIRATLAGATG